MRYSMPGATGARCMGGGAPQVRARSRLLEAADPAAAVLVQQLKAKGLSAADQRAAAIAILDRVGLKPTARLELAGANTGPTVDWSRFTTEELVFLQTVSRRLAGEGSDAPTGVLEESIRAPE